MRETLFQRLLINGIGAVALTLPATAHADDSTPKDIIIMKMMVVEAESVDVNPWYYLEFPNFEVLSRTDPTQTESVATHIDESLAANREFIPTLFWARPPTPMTFIMLDRFTPTNVAEVAPKSGEPDYKDANLYEPYRADTYSREYGSSTGDSDTRCIVQNRLGESWMWAGGGSKGPIQEGFRFELSQCSPPMPLWYAVGLHGRCGLLRVMPTQQGVVAATAKWITEADTDVILTRHRKFGTLPDIPPIESLFDHRISEYGGGPRPSPAWAAEAALFVRWGMFADFPTSKEADEHRQTFQAFVERSRIEPVTEAMFRGCFGFGFAKMREQLQIYLFTAAREPICVPYSAFDNGYPHGHADHGPYPFHAKKATADQIGRILGDWLRMQGNAIRASDPAESEAYIYAAGRVLERAYRDDNGLPPDEDPTGAGERPATAARNANPGTVVAMKPFVVSAKRIHDPKLLAVYGMYEHDIGHDAEARQFLEAAVKAGVERPAAYVDLAQMNLEAGEANPAGAAGRLSKEQVACVLTPLLDVLRKSRLGPAGYRLFAEAWAQSAGKPALGELTVLYAAIRENPFDTDLSKSIADVFAQWGYTAESDEILRNRSRYLGAG